MEEVKRGIRGSEGSKEEVDSETGHKGKGER